MLGLLRPAVAASAPQMSRAFHAGGAQLVRQKHMRRLNRLHKHWAKQLFAAEEEWVDPVLGKPRTPFLLRMQAVLSQPELQVDSLTPEETSRLVFGAQAAGAPAPATGDGDEAILAQHAGKLREDEVAHKREVLRRITSLQNSNRTQNQKQAVALARQEFQRFEGDTGSPEVQAAIATIRIHFVAAHAKETKKDVQAKRRLEHMVQTRRSTLLYLKRTDPKRYIWVVEKLGLSDATVMPEFHMSRHYLWRTQFYGDKTLPIKKTVRDTKKAREHATKLGKAERYLAQHDPDALMR